MRCTAEVIGRRLLGRSEVNEATADVNGARCREWRGAGHPQGYGRMWDGERLQYTHRLSYEVFVGAIPAGLDVLHACDNPGCIEVRHLRCGTHAENMADRDMRGRWGNGSVRRRGQSSPWLHGSRHPRASLDEDKVRTIWRRLRAPRGRQDRPAGLAREFEVSVSLIRGIEAGRNWGWLTGATR